MISVFKTSMLACACSASLVLGIGLPGTAQAAAVVLDLRITGDAADDDFFPHANRGVECLPSCSKRATRDDAQPPSIVTGELEGHQAWGDSSMHVEVSGRARIGDLGLSVNGFAGAATRNSRATANAFTSASWRDVITISTNALPFGERITMEATMSLFAVLDAIASGDGNAGVVLTISDLGGPSLVPSPYGGGLFGMQVYDLAHDFFVDRPTVDVVKVRMSLFNGRPMAIGYQMDLGGSGSSDNGHSGPNQALPGAMTMAGIAINSLHWGGIQRVSDSLGNAVDNFSVSSESGFDFTRPFTDTDSNGMPEPATAALLLAALAASRGVRRRRRCSRPQPQDAPERRSP